MSNEMEITNLTDTLARLNECMFGDNEIPLTIYPQKCTRPRVRLTVRRESELFDIVCCDGDIAAVFTYPYVYESKTLHYIARLIAHPAVADNIAQLKSRHSN